MEVLGICINMEMEKPPVPAEAHEKLSVRLLDAVQVPARHGCLARAVVEGRRPFTIITAGLGMWSQEGEHGGRWERSHDLYHVE